MGEPAGAQRDSLQGEGEMPAQTVAQIDVTQEHSLWTSFAEAATVEVFCRSWLALQCRMMGGVRSGMVLLGPADRGPFRPIVTWPEGRQNLKRLMKTAERTVAERRGLVARGEPAEGETQNGHYEIGYPIEVRGALHGAAVLEVAPKSEVKLQGMLRQLHWGAAWLELLFAREAVAAEKVTRERLQAALDLVATAVGHERFYASAMTLVTALATQFQCDRVSLGFVTRGRARVTAVSHSAQFKEQANVIRGMAEAMDEAIDQRETIVYPPPTEGASVVVQAHEAFAKEHGSGALLCVPLEAGGQVVGALLLERPVDRPFDQKHVDLCRSVAALIGPVLEVHRREDRWLGAKVWDSLTRYVRDLLGPGHVALKLSSVSLAALLAFCFLAKGDYRVSAKTVLEPVVQRAAAAPFNGYIRDAPVRAGELVRAGDVLCTLDDRELRLERLKSLSKFEEYQKEYHKAMGEREAAKVEILTAQMNQVRAEIELLDDQLAHTRMIAPFDGIVVSGDLSQSLGAPVEKGTVLFEIAPLDSYRVVLEVDERDIADVQAGQPGHLLLSAFPSGPVAVTISNVTPVSTAKDGRNFFRVEASLDQAHDRLRPAMEGAGKIAIDQRRLVWIWTHQVVDWIRLTAWTWLP
ncbi:MAG: HlyD family efflux transporter periplasmic adaptor subunit [Nitrospira sp.]|nr:HlyD family efflux transporter periplasmic adaptor subunit [Nitrospira sp.]MBH0185632.1 HlyD family efflux transporter periplasmic adaptor subunit [Nitrospira sp.]